MMTMLKVVSIFALVATAAAGIHDFRFAVEFDDDLIAIGDMYAEGQKAVRAAVINPDTEVEFLEEEEKHRLIKFLKAQSKPEVNEDEQLEVCGSLHGIELQDSQDVFCNLSKFGFGIKFYGSAFHTPHVILIFKSDSAKSIALEVPIFRVPAKLASAGEDELTNWGGDKKVGVSAPVDVRQLEDVEEGQPIKINLKWLTDVLSHGITKSKIPYKDAETNQEINTFVARPVVVSSAIVDKFIELFLYFDDNDVEEKKKQTTMKKVLKYFSTKNTSMSAFRRLTAKAQHLISDQKRKGNLMRINGFVKEVYNT